jgi:hypothetical protein
MAKKGSAKQTAFINAYNGNIEEAADIAGLSYGHARNLMTKPDIIQQIRDRAVEQQAPLIATRQQRQQFWTEVMQDTGEEMRNRLRAAELLGKSEADFTEKVQQTGKDGGPIENKWVVEIVKPEEK